MPIVKKLTRTGSSYSLIIDKSIMQLLSIDPELPVEITTDGKRLIIEPTHPDQSVESVADPKFQKAAKEALEQYREALEVLAK